MKTPSPAAQTIRFARRERTALATFARRWWRRLVREPAGSKMRALAPLLLVAFGLAVLAPPCEMHGSMHGGAHAAVEHGASHDQHGADDQALDDCTCLDDCHQAAALAITSSESSLPRVEGHPRVASWKPGIHRVNQPFILPFATAPPVDG